MDYYSLEQYEWLVKSLNYKLTRGFFVDFAVINDNVSICYPMHSNKHFAFCPSQNFRAFQELKKKPLLEVPAYIQFFDKSEIESLCANIPLRG